MNVLGIWLALGGLIGGISEQTEWVDRLGLLDDARAAAFVRGDPSLLVDVYTQGAEERTDDARLVRQFNRRGLEVDDVRFDVLAFRVERRSADRVVLRVVDRLAPVRVRREGGAWRTLPRDQPTERRITVVDTADGWRIASIDRLAG